MEELFTTERLIVRRLTPDDAEAMLAIYGDAEVVRFVGDATPLTLENCSYWIEVTDRNFENRGYGMVAGCDRTTGALIGCVGVVHPGQQEDPEVKYALKRDHWGMGLATELLTATVEYARSKLGKTFLIATVSPAHTASQNVLRKAGFHHASDRTNEDGSITQVWRWDSTSA